MKIYLAGLDGAPREHRLIWEHLKLMRRENILLSFFYLKKSFYVFDKVVNSNAEVLIDSGAHSFQQGKKVDFDKYTDEYCKFIKDNDCDKIKGYFEMDIDNIIGYRKVLELRERIQQTTDKLIPVWHKNRGVRDFLDMCDKYKYVAITGFKNEDIQDHQYKMFVAKAHEKGCRIHGLGMTRRKVLNQVPFDTVDSSSWARQVAYARIGNKHVQLNNIGDYEKAKYINFMNYKKMQKKYYKKWYNYTSLAEHK